MTDRTESRLPAAGDGRADEGRADEGRADEGHEGIPKETQP